MVQLLKSLLLKCEYQGSDVQNSHKCQMGMVTHLQF